MSFSQSSVRAAGLALALVALPFAWASVGVSSPATEGELVREFPIGAIVPFNAADCPIGWSPFAPAAGRAIVGAGAGDGLTPRSLGESGGAERVTLTVANLPPHQHSVYLHAGYHGGQDTGAHGGDTTTFVHGGVTSSVGGGAPHENMPPFVALTTCIHDDPSPIFRVGSLTTDTLRNAVVAFAGDACPDGWEPFAAGAGRAIVGAGEGDGLTPRALGDVGGLEAVRLTVAEMPAHQHGVYAHAGYHGGTTQGAQGGDTTTRVHGGLTGPTGGDAPHANMPPFLALLHCTKTTVSPVDLVLSGTVRDDLAGAIVAFDAAACPPSWTAHAASAGRLLVVAGEGEGLTPRAIGEPGGAETHALTIAEMPRHQHNVYHHAGYHGGQDTGAHGGDTTTRVHGGVTSPVGSGAPIANMPPFHVAQFCERPAWLP